MAKETKPERRHDRKLGDEWSDWDGSSGGEQGIDERLSTFFVLALCILLVTLALIPAGWYLIKPRVVQLSPSLSAVIEWSVLAVIGVVFFMAAAEGIAFTVFRRSLLPYRWTERLLLALLPGAVWLGGKLGISRDRVGSSFIKAHNSLLASNRGAVSTERLLVLLPRCLSRETRGHILERFGGSSAEIVTAGGGEEARAAIAKHRPTLILALACERDLMSGLKDVAEKIPVLAVPNKRPEGPCKNTLVSREVLDEALQVISHREEVR
ncbi:MAG: DUF116 domain-containing protein [Nitrospirota bacterium]